MIHVTKGNKHFPFSKGIMARSIFSSGLSVEEAYEIVQNIMDRLEEGVIKEIPSSELKRMISEVLLNRGHKTVERHYRVRSEIKYFETPIFILIGGGPGVGKSTLSSEVGHRLGINRVIGSDTIREIIRSIISQELIPTLHTSTFMACDKLKTPFVNNKLIYAFEQQVNLVSGGINSVMKRGMKEGLNMVINGVHIVPGFIDIDENECHHLYQYVLDVPDMEQHISHFYSREEGSMRSPHRYINNIDRIRGLQDYILDMADKNDVKILENVSFEKTLDTILDDVITGIEEETRC